MRNEGATSKKAAAAKPRRELDATDLKVLDLLQKDGRLANRDLAQIINLSPTPCLRRVSQLKEAGYIRGYRAVLDPAMLGFTLRAFLSLKRSRDSDREKLTEQIIAIPEVQACHVVSGEYDFLVELLARDMDDYARIAIGHISELPGIHDIRTTFSIIPLKTIGVLPLVAGTQRGAKKR
ncbi:MAG: hypothetical protein RL522_2440 [Pseudomonadota bacterium]|jgi:Lrp/AsnC family leucine-responsive transcriptional regulator